MARQFEPSSHFQSRTATFVNSKCYNYCGKAHGEGVANDEITETWKFSLSVHRPRLGDSHLAITLFWWSPHSEGVF